MSECKHGKHIYSFCNDCCNEINENINSELSEPKAELDRVVKCRNYQACVGNGWATFCLTLPEKSEKADIADLREWLKLIDKQLSRLEAEGI